MFAWSFSGASQFSCYCKVFCLSVPDGFFGQAVWQMKRFNTIHRFISNRHFLVSGFLFPVSSAMTLWVRVLG
jgi:hypothetical protein